MFLTGNRISVIPVTWVSGIVKYPKHRLNKSENTRSKLQPLKICNRPAKLTGGDEVGG